MPRTAVLIAILFASILPKIGVADDSMEESKRWLAIAFIAEAGWADPRHSFAEVDHRAIYHVLRRRWEHKLKRQPRTEFVDVVKGYVSAFDPRTRKGTRVRWLLSLRPGSDREPVGWPSNLSWNRHKGWWEAAQARAANCMAGVHCRNPFPLAWHWGGAMDTPKACMVELPNVGTYNTFYSLDFACRRLAIRRKRIGDAVAK